MGTINVELGFDVKTGHVTVDGQPHGEPVDFGAILSKVMERIGEKRTQRRRLFETTATRPHIWASMPKPPEGE